MVYDAAVSGAVSDESGNDSTDDAYHCGECGTAVRRVVTNISEAQFSPSMVDIREKFVCDCDETITADSTRAAKTNVPNGWV